MATQVYGCQDDLIGFEGDIDGETAYYSSNDEAPVIFLSDGTVLKIAYGIDGKAIWEIKLVEKGKLFDHIELCTGETDDLYSNVAHFKDGLTWAYVAHEFERVH